MTREELKAHCKKQIEMCEFRYGMERCVEIIDKYKAESEVDNGNDN